MNTKAECQTRETREDPGQAGEQDRDKRKRIDGACGKTTVIAQRREAQMDRRDEGEQRRCACWCTEHLWIAENSSVLRKQMDTASRQRCKTGTDMCRAHSARRAGAVHGISASEIECAITVFVKGWSDRRGARKSYTNDCSAFRRPAQSPECRDASHERRKVDSNGVDITSISSELILASSPGSPKRRAVTIARWPTCSGKSVSAAGAMGSIRHRGRQHPFAPLAELRAAVRNALYNLASDSDAVAPGAHVLRRCRS